MKPTCEQCARWCRDPANRNIGTCQDVRKRKPATSHRTAWCSEFERVVALVHQPVAPATKSTATEAA